MSKFLLSLLPLVASVSAAIPSDEIISLPGWNGPLPSKQYSGYIPVDTTPNAGRYLHYWLVESENNPATDPLVLWLNGGPGCSSLDGFLYELGPIHFGSGQGNSSLPELVYNPYTWAKVANVLFLESPAGVGFSYSESLIHIAGDNETATDNYQFLLNFFKAYPEYNNTFFIAGESYAGVYIPTLVDTIRQGNEAGRPFIPLNGFMVGNGCYGNNVGACGNGGDATKTNVEFLYGHDLYSAATYKAIQSSCTDFNSPSLACTLNLLQMGTEVGNVNIYNIFDDCINGNGGSEKQEFTRGGRIPSSFFSSQSQKGQGLLGGPSECIDGIAAGDFLNNAQVQAALHVKSTKWQVCAPLIYSRTAKDLRTIYPTLIKNYRTLIFNGDADACVPVLDNRDWTASLGLPVKSAWHAWTVDNQVAGYATVYDSNNFTFLTVKGAGHMVPQYRPKQALAMFTKFIQNEGF